MENNIIISIVDITIQTKIKEEKLIILIIKIFLAEKYKK
jgi:hypothetical protein